MADRIPISQLGLGTGKKARLHRILYQHGVGNGSGLFLPYDQGLEHGPRDFFANPPAADPRYILRLASEGGFNAIAIQIGLAEKFYWDYAGEVPLILKLNGKTEIPPSDEALSPLNATVEDAVRLGADAVVSAAFRTLVLVSGGEKAGDEALLEKARHSMQAGASGLIYGRNIWQRDHDASLRLISQLRDIVAQHPAP